MTRSFFKIRTAAQELHNIGSPPCLTLDVSVRRNAGSRSTRVKCIFEARERESFTTRAECMTTAADEVEYLLSREWLKEASASELLYQQLLQSDAAMPAPHRATAEGGATSHHSILFTAYDSG